MVAISSIELPVLSANPTRVAAKASVSDSSQPAFSESMLAASNVSSQIGSLTDGSPNATRRQRYSLEDANTPSRARGRHAGASPNDFQQMVTASQPELSQEAPLTIPNVIPMHLPRADGVEASNTSIVVANGSIRSTIGPRLSGIESNNAQLGVVLSADPQPSKVQQGSGQGQTGSILLDSRSQVLETSVMPSPTTRNNLSNKAATVPSNTAQRVPSNAVSDAVQNTVPRKLLNVSLSRLLDATALPNPTTVPNAAANVSDKFLLESALSPIHNANSNTVQSSVPDVVPTALSNVSSSLLPVAASLVAINASAKRDAAPTLGNISTDHVIPNTVAVDHTLFGTGPSGTGTTADQSVVPTALSKVPSSPVPVAASLVAVNAPAKRDAAPILGNISPDHVIANTAGIDQTLFGAGPSGTGAMADQSVVPTQPGGGLSAAATESVASMNPVSGAKAPTATVINGKDGSKDAARSAAGLKQNSQPTSSQLGSQPSSSEAAPSGNQSQGGTSSQGQEAVAPQANFPNQADSAIFHAQTTAIASSMQIASTPVSAAGHAAKAPDNAAPTSSALPQALPAINTAKLIQTMGQSEMRVGIHSTEFGNISISTSASRDLISAQISLDHGELAKVLAAHLPEMQAKLGGNQTVDVRIDTSSVAVGHSAGTFGGAANGSAEESRGGRHQSGNATSGYSGGRISGRTFSSPAATMTRSDGGQNSRLDVRV